jgi:hypothetical protein
MAVQISTNVEFIQANTTTNAGFILLPSTTTLAGRLLTIKDTTGTFGLRPLTLSTIGNDRFEEGVNLKLLTEPFGYITLASDGVNRWYTIDGTSMNTYTISTLTNPVSISTQSMFTSSATVSTLGFEDRNFNTVSSFYTRSTLLYLGSNIIGGSKCGPTLFVPIRRPFLPNQVSGLNLWIDAADPNTFASTRGNIISSIFDKSGARSIINTFDNTSVVYEPSGLLGLPSFNLVNGHLRGTISTSRPMTRYTNTTFIVTQLITAPPANGYPCMALAEAAIGSGTFYRNLDYSTVGPSFRQVGFFAGVAVTSNAAQVGTPFIMNTNYSAALNGNTLFMRYNGSSAGVVTQSAATAPTTTATHFFVGTDGFTNTYATDPITWTGRVSEILMYNVQLTQAQQEQVEGYLAWKWNLVTNLPLNHPFRTAPP